MSQRYLPTSKCSYRFAVYIITCVTLLGLATCGKDSPTKTVTPPQPPAPQPPTPQPPTTTQPARITITPRSASLSAIGQRIQLSATIYDNRNVQIPEAAVSWSSNDPAVATVGAQGLVTAVGNGTATITARSGNASETASVTVLQTIASIVVFPMHSTLYAIGETVQLNALASDRSLQSVADAAFTWISDKPAVATVSDQGLVTAVSKGTATITARSGNASETATVTVVSRDDTRLNREALVALYHSTNGPGWTNSTNWLSDAPLGNWHGLASFFHGEVEEVRHLNLRENNLQGKIPPEIGQLQSLVSLGLSNNQLTGNIPPEIGQLNELTSMELSNNQLSGYIPSEIGQLQKLTSMGLYNNQLTGNIPSEIGQLRKLTSMGLYNNQLTGNIPSEIGQLQELTFLGLYNNQLTGNIPTEIGQLQELTRLDLSNNQLTGNIPTEIGQLQELTELFLGYNSGLTGPLSVELIMLSNLEFFYIHNTQICIPQTSQYLAWFEGIRNRSGGLYCPAPHRDSLIALYDRTDGPNWTNSTNWKSLDPLDQWYGITVDGEGQVTGLSLENNNLNGAVPHHLSDLSNLKILNLSFNPGLTGILPASVSRLELEELELDGTQVCAPADTEFQQWLADIPQRTVTNCTDLRPDYYALAGLYFNTTGQNWTNNTNWLSDRPLNTWFGVQTNSSEEVTGLDLKENNLAGAIPSEIGQLQKLENLYLYRNQLSGSIPQEIGQLQELRFLDLSDNRLAGDLPPEIWRLQKLENLFLYGNQLSGSIPPEIGQLQKLENLFLYGNQLSGSIPQEIGQLQELRFLYLSDNRLAGDLPPEIWRLQNLRALAIRGDAYNRDSGIQLTGIIPAEVAQLENLETLNLEFNRLTGNIPPEIGDLQKLRYLRLGGNRLTGTIPSEIGKLHNLVDLILSNNRLTGNIPSNIGQLPTLVTLDLSRNELEGSIPAEIGGLQSLTQLTLSNNQLTGTIPTEFAGLGMLEVLRVSFNRLSGSIPDSFGDLANLRYLGLTDNANLSGTLPLSLIGLNLDDLLLGGTMLCAPEITEIQDWLREIPNSRVSRCDTINLRSVAYLTQAVQTLEYPVPLVAGEDALLRVFVTSETDMDAYMPLVRATFYEGSAEVHTVDMPSQETPIPTEVDEGDLSSSANARIPGSVLTPGLEMVIEIDPEGELDPALGINGRLPAEGRIAIDVREMPPFDLTMVPFLWTENPDRSILARVEGLTADSELFRLTRDILPVGEFYLTIREPVWTSVEPTPHNFGSTFRETVTIHAMDGAGGHYMGVLTGSGTGLANAPGVVSVSTLDNMVIAHELGHNMSLGHAPCEIGSNDHFIDPDYPYPVSAVGVWGYDLLNEMPVQPDTKEVMGCGSWISDYFFTKAIGYRYYQENETLFSAAYEPPVRGLLLWGGVNSDGEVLLEPAFVVDASPSLPDLYGPYLLSGEDDVGGTLFSLSFGMAEIADGDGERAFAFIIPASTEWSNRLTHLTLSGPEGVATLGGDGGLEEEPAAALLLDPTTGKVRGLLRDWPVPGITAVSARRVLPEPGLEVFISSGVPAPADWRR